MNSRFFLSLMLLICAVGGGYWLGQRRTPTAVTPPLFASPTAKMLRHGTRIAGNPQLLHGGGGQNAAVRKADAGGH